jgi:hypothetical protein
MEPWGTPVPDAGWIWSHIEDIYRQGVRRPGYPADAWAKDHVDAWFRWIGLETVRREPVTVPYWRDHACRLRVGDVAIDAGAVPFSRPGTVTAPLARWNPATPATVAGKIAVHDVRLLALPAAFPAGSGRTPSTAAGSAPAAAGWVHDPGGTLAGEQHLLPFAPELQAVMDGPAAAGAVGFVGVPSLPGGGRGYYVPYDGETRPVPGAYVDAVTAGVLDAAIAAGTEVELTVEAERSTVEDHNVVGELPGADDEWVVVASHHDGPWASAVEDATGIALVLAQARTWAGVAEADRPHRLVFSVNAGHMAGAAGTRAFLDRHRARLAEIVVEVHLEHAAALGPEVAPEHPDRPVPRWWFTSEEPRLEAAVWDALVAEDLDRSLLLCPTALGPRPTTDGGHFHDEGVPLVNYLTAPWYLFDPRDDLDKVHRPSLVPVTRAAARIVAASSAWTAADLRAGIRPRA